MDVSPVSEQAGVPDLKGLGVALHEFKLHRVERGSNTLHLPWRHAQQQVSQVAVLHLAHELRHDSKAAGHRDRALLWCILTGDEAQQRGLACAIGTHQGRHRPGAHTKGHVVEQWPAVGQRIGDVLEVDVAHDYSSSPASRVCRVKPWRLSSSASAG